MEVQDNIPPKLRVRECVCICVRACMHVCVHVCVCVCVYACVHVPEYAHVLAVMSLLGTGEMPARLSEAPVTLITGEGPQQ